MRVRNVRRVVLSLRANVHEERGLAIELGFCICQRNTRHLGIGDALRVVSIRRLAGIVERPIRIVDNQSADEDEQDYTHRH